MIALRPFWFYFGGKSRAAKYYPPPAHETVIEPFAGAAGYSLRYSDRNVILVEKYPVIAEIWRYLISVSPQEVLSIPVVDHVDDLPSWVPEGGRYLVGFAMGDARTSPGRRVSAGVLRNRERYRNSKFRGWTIARRQRVADQVTKIRHWRIIEGDFTNAPNVTATWFVDPPYDNKAGKAYVCKFDRYNELGAWCRDRQGQVIVCENEGADWLPFKPFRSIRSMNNNGSKEVLWYMETPAVGIKEKER